MPLLGLYIDIKAKVLDWGAGEVESCWVLGTPKALILESPLHLKWKSTNFSVIIQSLRCKQSRSEWSDAKTFLVEKRILSNFFTVVLNGTRGHNPYSTNTAILFTI